MTVEREEQCGNTACSEKKRAKREIAGIVFHRIVGRLWTKPRREF
jgi:hypothetical protein